MLGTVGQPVTQWTVMEFFAKMVENVVQYLKPASVLALDSMELYVKTLCALVDVMVALALEEMYVTVAPHNLEDPTAQTPNVNRVAPMAGRVFLSIIAIALGLDT